MHSRKRSPNYGTRGSYLVVDEKAVVPETKYTVWLAARQSKSSVTQPQLSQMDVGAVITWRNL
ncbi:hypothetical protein PRZ48_008839 [Zasmidium cellare]|uniref:Uncharacterized protein n=1 Tax=Zasmidium cellare TaxID=395010 RepID=A0ABR0EHA5_ZASCE|nr:hypothetical protein PRZ48_008839 [Zasmidium cellare]